MVAELPLREIGIKAKHGAAQTRARTRASAPRNWNQGKAFIVVGFLAYTSFRSAKLESRQSQNRPLFLRGDELPLREIGIKAKPSPRSPASSRRASAPRNWNQGKAATMPSILNVLSFRSAKLESRQSKLEGDWKDELELPLREIGIKAKLAPPAASSDLGASAPRNWNQGKAHPARWRWCHGASAPRNWNQGKAKT